MTASYTASGDDDGRVARLDVLGVIPRLRIRDARPFHTPGHPHEQYSLHIPAILLLYAVGSFYN